MGYISSKQCNQDLNLGLPVPEASSQFTISSYLYFALVVMRYHSMRFNYIYHYMPRIIRYA